MVLSTSLTWEPAGSAMLVPQAPSVLVGESAQNSAGHDTSWESRWESLGLRKEQMWVLFPVLLRFSVTLGAAFSLGLRFFYFGKGEMNVCSSVSTRLLKEPKTKTVNVGRDFGAQICSLLSPPRRTA